MPSLNGLWDEEFPGAEVHLDQPTGSFWQRMANLLEEEDEILNHYKKSRLKGVKTSTSLLVLVHPNLSQQTKLHAASLESKVEWQSGCRWSGATRKWRECSTTRTAIIIINSNNALLSKQESDDAAALVESPWWSQLRSRPHFSSTRMWRSYCLCQQQLQVTK